VAQVIDEECAWIDVVLVLDAVDRECDPGQGTLPVVETGYPGTPAAPGGRAHLEDPGWGPAAARDSARRRGHRGADSVKHRGRPACGGMSNLVRGPPDRPWCEGAGSRLTGRLGIRTSKLDPCQRGDEGSSGVVRAPGLSPVGRQSKK